MKYIIGRAVSNALARVLVIVVLAGAAWAWSNFAEASEFNTGGCSMFNGSSVSGVTFAQCKTQLQAWYDAGYQNGNPNYSATLFTTGWILATGVTGPYIGYERRYTDNSLLGSWSRQSTVACPSGEVEDEVTGDCSEQEEEPPWYCGVGYINVDGGPTAESCVAIPPVEGSCANPVGYINGIQVCGDDALSCAATGGSYGTIFDEPVCIPPGDDIPECAAGTFVYVAEGENSFVCVRPTATPPEDEPVDPNDWDGDGISNASDSDDDNDGSVDSVDADDNGDGVADSDSDSDGTGDQDDTDDDNDGVEDVADGDDDGDGAGDCDPTSAGYQECVGLLQDVSDGLDETLLNQANASAGVAIEQFGQDAIEAVGDGVTDIATDEAGALGDMVSSFIPSTSCSDFVHTVNGKTFEITCERTAPLREMLSWLLFVLTAYSVFNIFMAKGVNS